MKKAWLSIVVAAAFTAVIAAGSALAEDINAYMGLSPENNKKVVDLVREKTGIQINQTFQSFGEIEAKVKSEAPNFNADMVTGCGSPLAFMAKKNGWTVPFVSAGWKGISDVYADPQGHWFNIANFSFVLVGNKDNLKKKGLKMPTS